MSLRSTKEIKRLLRSFRQEFFNDHIMDPAGSMKARVVEIYRPEDGKLAEHWDVLMPV